MEAATTRAMSVSASPATLSLTTRLASAARSTLSISLPTYSRRALRAAPRTNSITQQQKGNPRRMYAEATAAVPGRSEQLMGASAAVPFVSFHFSHLSHLSSASSYIAVRVVTNAST